MQLWYVAGQLARIAGPGNATVGRDTMDFTYEGGYLVKVRDSLASDVVAAGLRPDNDAVRWLIGYDVQGRASTLSAPEPTPGALRPGKTITYGTSSATVDDHGTTATPERSVTVDTAGRALTETDAASLTTSFIWDDHDRIVATTDPANRRTTSTYNTIGDLTDEWGPAPAAWFDASGVPVGHESQTPHLKMSYDDGFAGLAATWWDNPVQVDMPSGRSTGLLENPDGSINFDWGTGVPAGSNVTNTDSFSGRLSGRITFPVAGTYYLGFARNGPVRVHLDDELVIDGWTEVAGNVASGPIVVTAGESRTIDIDIADTGTTSPLNQFRLLMTWSPPTGGWQVVPGSQLVPDYGLLTRTIDPDGRRTDTAYAAPETGLVTATVIDPLGLALTTTMTHEPEGTGYSRLLTRTLPAGAVTKVSTTYYGETETADNPCTPAVESIHQGGLAKNITEPDPDGTGPLTRIIYRQRYDSAARLVGTRVGSEPWSCLTYDARGRLASESYPAFGGAPARTVEYDYAGSGNPLVSTVSDPSGTIATTVDLLDRPIASTDVHGMTVASTYDQAGRVTQVVGPVGTVGYTYDAASRPDVTTLDGAALADITYNTNGELASVTYPSPGGNGTALSAIGRDTSGGPTSVLWSLAGGVTVTNSVARTLSGNIIDETTDGIDAAPAGPNYVYDGAGRLVGAKTLGHEYTYQFAAAGGCGTLAGAGKNTNRTSMTHNGATSTYCYDRADRLTSTTHAGYTGAITYDSHGNATSIGGETRHYDADNRHWKTTSGTTAVTYTFDPLGGLASRDDGSSVIKYTDGATMTASGTVIERTLTLPGGVLLTKRSTGDVWSYPNVRGDFIATANSAGTKQGSTLLWSPFGQALTNIPDNRTEDMDHGWLGQYQISTEHEPGLLPTLEMGARQYDPALGRFLETDPIEAGSANDYDYCNADPVNCLDLDGLSHELFGWYKYKHSTRHGTVSAIWKDDILSFQWGFYLSLWHQRNAVGGVWMRGNIYINGRPTNNNPTRKVSPSNWHFHGSVNTFQYMWSWVPRRLKNGDVVSVNIRLYYNDRGGRWTITWRKSFTLRPRGTNN